MQASIQESRDFAIFRLSNIRISFRYPYVQPYMQPPRTYPINARVDDPRINGSHDFREQAAFDVGLDLPKNAWHDVPTAWVAVMAAGDWQFCVQNDRQAAFF